jgi:hypothetical protein
MQDLKPLEDEYSDPAIQEAKIRRMEVWGHPGENVSKTHLNQ